MSDMEMLNGFIRKSDLDIEPDGTDEFSDLEKEHECRFVKVRGQLYSFHPAEDLNAYGFEVLLPPSTEYRAIASWYNGGAGIHEVLSSLIEHALASGVEL